MSRIEELIAELCPNGVEFIKLGEHVKILRGKRLTTRDMVNDAQYPVYHGGIVPIGKYDKKNRNANTTMIINVGASAGTIGYSDVDFWSSDGCFCLEQTNLYDDRFLFHIMLTYERYLKSKVRRAGIPTLDNKVIEKLVLPVPPLEVQREIVRVLDSFTLLTAELTAELTARKKQYDFYRNKLLTFDVEIEYKSLEEIAVNRCTGGTPLKANRDFYEGGNIPWLRTQEVVYNEIKSTECFITEEAVKKTSAKWIPVNCVIVAISGASAGRCAINKIPLTTNQHCLNIEVNVNIVDYKYVYYCLCNQYEELVGKKEGARGDLSVARIMSLKIPIPSLDSQKRIVAILDRFDILCNNISLGLPAEIEARRKQYEYYRDKLLSF